MELWFYMRFVTPPIHFGRVIPYVLGERKERGERRERERERDNR